MMKRADFGNWGIELSELDFARAVASIGVYSARQPVWPIPGTAEEILQQMIPTDPEAPIPCKFFVARPERFHEFKSLPDAATLAQAFAGLVAHLRWPRRFALNLDATTATQIEDIAWLQEMLTAAIQGPAACHVVVADEPMTPWRWPLRFGFLRDPVSLGMADLYEDARRKEPWVATLTERVALPSSGQRPVEFLVLPGDAEAALKLLESQALPVSAHATIVFGGPGVFEAEPIRRISALTASSTVVVVDPGDIKNWLIGLARNLSHDASLDCAIPFGRPLIWSPTKALDACKPSDFGKRVARRALEFRPDVWVPVSEFLANELRLPRQVVRLAALAQAFLVQIENVGWTHEGDGSTVTVEFSDVVTDAVRAPGFELVGGVGGTLAGAPPFEISPPMGGVPLYGAPQPVEAPPATGRAIHLPPEPRFLQASVTQDNERVRRAFIAGQSHQVAIHIEPPNPDLIGGRGGPTDLPVDDEGGHTLTIVFFEPELMPEPLVASTFLPEVGPAKPVRFPLAVPREAKQVEARVTVLRDNRVLQTGLLRGPVTSSWQFERYGEPTPSHTTPSERTEETLTELEFVSVAELPLSHGVALQEPFSGAIVVNHIAGRAGATHVRGSKAVYVRLDSAEIKALFKDFEDTLAECDWQDDRYRSLHADGTTDLLRKLAWKGAALQKKVVGVFGPHLNDDRQSKLQVVAAVLDARFPVEFVYDCTPPSLTAKVCPSAKKGLASGKCKTCDQADLSNVVCPFGFWFANRVIEWHAFSEKYVDATKGAPIVLQAGDGEGRGLLKAMRNPIIGYTDEVKKVPEGEAHLTKLLNEASAAAKSKVPAARSWNEWSALVKAKEPALQLLLVHVGNDARGPLMELGTDSKTNPMLPAIGLTRAHFFGRDDSPPPIVLLLGCKTGTGEVQLQSVVSSVESCHAAVTVSTIVDVYGPTAADLGRFLVERLAAVNTGDTFGDVMLDVRRRALAEGLPMVLCLRAYGDADWRLEA